jgi:hypothetical protein
MSKPNSAFCDCIVRALAPTEHGPDEAPITMVCEPLSLGDGVSPRGAMSMPLMAGTTREEARAIASTLQARVKRLCHLDAPGAESTRTRQTHYRTWGSQQSRDQHPR